MLNELYCVTLIWNSEQILALGISSPVTLKIVSIQLSDLICRLGMLNESGHHDSHPPKL